MIIIITIILTIIIILCVHMIIYYKGNRNRYFEHETFLATIATAVLSLLIDHIIGIYKFLSLSAYYIVQRAIHNFIKKKKKQNSKEFIGNNIYIIIYLLDMFLCARRTALGSTVKYNIGI